MDVEWTLNGQGTWIAGSSMATKRDWARLQERVRRDRRWYLALRRRMRLQKWPKAEVTRAGSLAGLSAAAALIHPSPFCFGVVVGWDRAGRGEVASAAVLADGGGIVESSGGAGSVAGVVDDVPVILKTEARAGALLLAKLTAVTDGDEDHGQVMVMDKSW
jgi:hypothetical protein